jgi:hypothetical protein
MGITCVVSYMTVYSITAMNGSKFYNGMICGTGECLAALFCGGTLKFYSDRVSFLIFAFLCLMGNIGYQLSGAGEGGLLSKCILFVSILGIGGNVNTTYLLL